MKRKIAIACLILVAMLLGLYAGDYLVLRFRVATNRNAFGTVNVYSYYAVGEKNNKTEFVFDHQGPETCANSLFPHLGDPPCWYLRRHTQQRIDI